MLFNFDYFTMLWNLLVVRCVFFILDRLMILNRSLDLRIASRGSHMMNFNILSINRHLEIFDNSWLLVMVSELKDIRLNDMDRGLYNLNMVSRNRHCNITFVRV